jgi:hypothetical protein
MSNVEGGGCCGHVHSLPVVVLVIFVLVRGVRVAGKKVPGNI